MTRSEPRETGVEVVDGTFHDAYGELRDAAAREVPVLVLFGEQLILLQGERRTEFLATAGSTEIIRAAAHGPVGIFALLHEPASDGTAFDRRTSARLSQLRSALVEWGGPLATLQEPARSDVRRVLDLSLGLVERALAAGRTSKAELHAFAAGLGPLLLRLTEHATRLELDALHDAVEAALSQLSAAERSELEVVVAGVHQARARSLAMQYFQARFGEAPGEERRVAYAESIGDPTEAHDLVGVRRLDRTIARAFFDDEKRLQRDVLGDAAEQLLAKTELDRI